MPTQNPRSNVLDTFGNTPLTRALDQNESAQQGIEDSVTELELINIVLHQELPEHMQRDDVALALEKSSELESRLQQSASDLAEVNETLSHEIAERAALEKELFRTRVALEEAKKDTQDS